MLHAVHDFTRGVFTLGPTAKDDGVAGFQAKRTCIRTHIGAGFIDHSDDTNRAGNTLDGEAVRALKRCQNTVNRIRELGDIFQRGRHAFDPLRREPQPVDEGIILFALDAFDVLFVGCENFVLAVPQSLSSRH